MNGINLLIPSARVPRTFVPIKKEGHEEVVWEGSPTKRLSIEGYFRTSFFLKVVDLNVSFVISNR